MPDNVVTTCSICGKKSDQPHTPATREPHGELFVRHGWSLMCESPLPY
jgi:hypothetical protein